jgi:hypothetical protein
LQKEGDALCIEEFGKKLGYVVSTPSYVVSTPLSTYFTATFECPKQDEDVKWVNPLPFDAGAEDLVMSLARHASEMIAYFHRNISKLKVCEDSKDLKHTTLSLVLQLDQIPCVTWKHASKMPLEVRFQNSADYAQQGPTKKQKGVRYRLDRQKWIAEYNPPGKKNHKISLGEYDNADEAARAADAGIFIYANKRTAYNFEDSPNYLQRADKPAKEDKDAVRKWARDFAKQSRFITDSTQSRFITNSATQSRFITDCTPATTSNSTWSDGGSSMMLQHCNSSISVSNIPPFGGDLDYTLDSVDSSSFSLEEVTGNYYPEMMTPPAMTTTPLTIQDIDQDVVDLPPMSSDLPVQINSNPPPLDLADDGFFRQNDPFWDSSPPLIRTVSDPRTSLQDDLFQWYYAPPTSSPSIQLIR